MLILKLEIKTPDGKPDNFQDRTLTRMYMQAYTHVKQHIWNIFSINI